MSRRRIRKTGARCLNRSLNDMVVPHRAFKKYTEDKKCIVKEEILEMLCRVLPDSELIRGSVVTLDGYTGFTPVQYRLLELLLQYCRRVVVTITMIRKKIRTGKAVLPISSI